jgi:hypothetical protein
MIKAFISTFVLVFLLSETKAQNDVTPADGSYAKNAVYMELLGNGFAYSLNYERLLLRDNLMTMRGRIGVTPGFVNLFKGIAIPLEVNACFIENRGHALETGIGFTWFNGKSRYRNKDLELITSQPFNAVSLSVRVGYRYQLPGRGPVFRAGFLPTFSVFSPDEVRNNSFLPFGKPFTPWGGLSAGYVF